MTYIIAEIGVNHAGSQAIARKLIDEAIEAGADAVKFQTFSAERLEPEGPRRRMLSGLEFTKQTWFGLCEYAGSKNIEFLSTPFSVEDLYFLETLGLDRIKISSGSLGDEKLLKEAARNNHQLIISTGMSDIKRIKQAIEWTGRRMGERITLLHCTSSYPTPVKEVNLRAMMTLRSHFSCPVGLSDHTTSINVPIAASALGAIIIEKHITLSRDMGGPDHHASLEPHEFKQMVQGIREVDMAMGEWEKKIQPSEIETMKITEERRKWAA